MPSRQYIPPTEDPRWERWCEPLLEYIKEGPRTWGDLRGWAKVEKIRPGLLLAMVCWLEFYRRICAIGEGDSLLWIAGRDNDEKET
jgi:hypothetical protein